MIDESQQIFTPKVSDLQRILVDEEETKFENSFIQMGRY